MRGLVTLVIVFGAVCVVYVAYWAQRAVSAGRDAAFLLKETGSVTETARRLYAHESTPDAYRLSASQRDYVDQNFSEFFGVYGPVVREFALTLANRFRSTKEASGHKLSETEWENVQQGAIYTAMSYHAKQWCEMRGVR